MIRITPISNGSQTGVAVAAPERAAATRKVTPRREGISSRFRAQEDPNPANAAAA